MKRFVTLIAATVVSSAAFSQETYSLKKAIDYSLKNNRSNIIYQNDVRKANAQAKEALSAYLPQVNATTTFDNNLKLQTTVLPGAIAKQEGDVRVTLGSKYNATAVIQLDQTIYDQALIYGIKAGVPAKLIADLNVAKNNEDLMYNTTAAYAQILLLKEQKKLLDANAKQYEELYRVTQFRFDKGVVKKVDLDRVTVQLNNTQSQQKQIQTDIEVATNTLKNAIGLPLTATLQVEDNLDYGKYQQAVDNDFDIRRLIDYKLQQQSVALQEIDVKRKQAAYLPTVTGYARYGQQALGNDVNKVVDNWNPYSAIGVRMNVPIFSGRRREAQLQESKLDLDNAKQNLELNTEQLQLQFQNAGRSLQENIVTLGANKGNMDLAKTVYSTTKFEYEKGVSTMSDLLNADYSYQQAQVNYMRSMLELVTNRLRYERAKGTIAQFVSQL